MAVDTMGDQVQEGPAGTGAVAPPSVEPGGTPTSGPVPTGAPAPATVRPVPWPVPELGRGSDTDVLDDPDLVLTEGYIGRERRRPGARALFARSTWAGRRRLLRLDLLIALALVTMVLGALLLVASGPPVRTAAPAPRSTTGAPAADGPPRARPHTVVVRATPPVASAPSAGTPVPAPATPSATTDATPSAAPDTPTAMGAAALALVRYPWRQLPGYSIVFRSIADAPSPGFYGNTTFTWGRPGGVSTLYVYPGETVERLAAITAFEIGHEVDAAYVEPRGGHGAVESLLGVHPASWAPECDCAEQGYLSGWYAAAFSDYWSPGVGAWSWIAPVPTGATLVALEPWLDPAVP